MKRCSPEMASNCFQVFAKPKLEDISAKFKQQEENVHTEKLSTAESASASAAKEGDGSPDLVPSQSVDLRIQASSKVNFSKLSQKEQYLRFKNQANEIRTLKAQLDEYGSCKRKKETTAQKAIDKIKASKVELEDQHNLIENVIFAIVKGKLVPNTLPYNQICTIIRDALRITYPTSKRTVNLEEGTLPISEMEAKCYYEQHCSKQTLRTIIGRKLMPSESSGDVLKNLHFQMNLCSLAFNKQQIMNLSQIIYWSQLS
eukprot:TRINITY_DN10489_c0_g1_i1.p1 TRINITY_DN10489_c0_g1~~TRINITY_DN10489_c0_g1_i1.p1  ORF type:complete len:258 (+),score=31.95 TRINITY_DN10489_c0_g1_i1:19-792(+)